MENNLEKYKQDLERLIKTGADMVQDLSNKAINKKNKKGEQKHGMIFRSKYEKWYSESHEVIRQILPNRLDDFKKLYKMEKRKKLDAETYTIKDFLIGIVSLKNSLGEKYFDDIGSAFMKFQNQVDILKSAQARFDSIIFDIQQIVRADLFDSELDAAKELLQNGFLRAAGAVAGVVLEKHLEQICKNHNVVVNKKNPSISDYNDLLKNQNVIEIPTWRFIQHLGDLRNLCDHNKKREPTKEEVNDLLEGTDKITKTVF